MGNNITQNISKTIAIVCFAIACVMFPMRSEAQQTSIGGALTQIKNQLSLHQLDSLKKVSEIGREKSLRRSAAEDSSAIVRDENGEIIATRWGSILPSTPYTPASAERLKVAQQSANEAIELWSKNSSNGKYDLVPQQPNPPRLINDYSGILTKEQSDALEIRALQFAQETSNQVAVVIMPTFYNYEKADLAFRIGNKWGVGQEKFNNGVVMLIKPKVSGESGEVFIAVGTGLEGALTDATANRIIDLRMIPAFRENDYYSAINDAFSLIFPIAAGEISTDEFANAGEEVEDILAILFGLLFIAFAIIMLYNIGKDNNNNMGSGNRRDEDFASRVILGNMINSINRGGFGSSNGWGSGGGFGGGGFGGFGGGGFSGGGAGGSW